LEYAYLSNPSASIRVLRMRSMLTLPLPSSSLCLCSTHNLKAGLNFT
jgi:hypothetical protein